MKLDLFKMAFAAGFAVLAAGSSMAAPEGGAPAAKPKGPNPMAIAPRIAMKMADEAVLGELGVKEGRRAKIAARAASLRDKFQENTKAMRELDAGNALQNALQAKDGGEMDAAVAKIKRAGQLRTEREILSVRALAMAKNSLDEKQRGKFREIMVAEAAKKPAPKAPKMEKDRKGPPPPHGDKGPRADRDKGPKKDGDRPAMKGPGPKKDGECPMMKGKGPKKDGECPMMKGKGPKKDGECPMMKGKQDKGEKKGCACGGDCSCGKGEFRGHRGFGPRRGGWDGERRGRGFGPRRGGWDGERRGRGFGPRRGGWDGERRGPGYGPRRGGRHGERRGDWRGERPDHGRFRD